MANRHRLFSDAPDGASEKFSGFHRYCLIPECILGYRGISNLNRHKEQKKNGNRRGHDPPLDIFFLSSQQNNTTGFRSANFASSARAQPCLFGYSFCVFFRRFRVLTKPNITYLKLVISWTCSLSTVGLVSVSCQTTPQVQCQCTPTPGASSDSCPIATLPVLSAERVCTPRVCRQTSIKRIIRYASLRCHTLFAWSPATVRYIWEKA